MSRILIVDDEAGICRAFEQFLGRAGHQTASAASAEEGLEQVDRQTWDLVLLDIRLPGMDGLTALGEIRERSPKTPVIVMTAHGTMNTAIEAVKGGAFEYITKPIDLDHAGIQIEKALEQRRLSEQVESLRAQLALSGDRRHGTMVGTSPGMQEVYKRIGAVAPTEATVLIRGESGSGKELVAQALHHNSPRADGPLVTVNCASVPETLLESELFGHVKGAFTSAVADKAGKAERAAGGTLFLDEIAEIPQAAQAKLLRFVETRTLERVGSTEPITVDVRIVAATHQDLEARLRDGEFREDLYYRLNVVTINIPPLRERPEDIPVLVASFLETSRRDGGSGEISDEALEALQRYNWPGNVRELRNAVEHAVVIARGRAVGVEHLPRQVLAGAAAEQEDELAALVRRLVRGRIEETQAPDAEPNIYDEMLREFEIPVIDQVLRMVGGNQVQAARLLGMHRTTLRKKIEMYGLQHTGRQIQQ